MDQLLEVPDSPVYSLKLPSPFPNDLNTSPQPKVSLLAEISTITIGNLPQIRQLSRSQYINPAPTEMCHRVMRTVLVQVIKMLQYQPEEETYHVFSLFSVQ